MKSTKTVTYANGRPVITIRVPGYRRVLNAPKPQIKLTEGLGIKETKFGF